MTSGEWPHISRKFVGFSFWCCDVIVSQLIKLCPLDSQSIKIPPLEIPKFPSHMRISLFILQRGTSLLAVVHYAAIPKRASMQIKTSLISLSFSHILKSPPSSTLRSQIVVTSQSLNHPLPLPLTIAFTPPPPPPPHPHPVPPKS